MTVYRRYWEWLSLRKEARERVGRSYKSLLKRVEAYKAEPPAVCKTAGGSPKD